MPKTHELKIWPSQFAAVVDGRKTHEWRKRDRDYQLGDTLRLEEYEPHGTLEESTGYTGRRIDVVVTWINFDFGVPEGFVVMSIKKAGELAWTCPTCASDESRLEDGDLLCGNGHVLVPEAAC